MQTGPFEISPYLLVFEINKCETHFVKGNSKHEVVEKYNKLKQFVEDNDSGDKCFLTGVYKLV